MKKLLVISISVLLSTQAVTQTWRMQVDRISGKPKSKTVRIQSGHNLTIGSLVTENDSLLETRYFEGIFREGGPDSILMNLSVVNETKTFKKTGITETAKIPARYYLHTIAPDTNLLKVALPDVAFLESRNNELGGWSELAEPIILLSVLNMVVSPFICYNYKDGTFNADRYKYFAVSSSIGMAAGMATAFSFSALSKHHKLQFREGWPSKKAKAWKFKPNK